MMQYGSLIQTQIDRFKDNQSYIIRKPSFVVWIEGFNTSNGSADPTEYIIEIDTEFALESPLGYGYINIGSAILIAYNYNGCFYSEGKSRIRKNAKIKIWAGFDNLNIPIFTGIVQSVSPQSSQNIVTISCKDNMGLFQYVNIQGSQEPNNTPKSLIEHFCQIVNVSANIPSTDETMCEYAYPYFNEQTLLSSLEEVCNGIFYVAYFDEDGRLNVHEREYGNPVEFQFNQCNVIDSGNLTETEIINDLSIEYDDGFVSKWENQWSIDSYGRNSKSYSLLLLNSISVSEMVTGSASEILDNSLEAFMFTASDNAAIIDSILIKMKQDDAHGYISVKLCSDNYGIPGELLANSQLKASANLSSEFAWELFYFSPPIQIWPSSQYWVVIDTSTLSSGYVHVQINTEDALSKYAYYDGDWNAVNNKQALHRIRGSIQGQRLAQDVVRFYSSPHEHISVVAPAVPQLQIFDEVLIEEKMRGVYGHYVIEGRRHIMSSDKYITIDILRKVSY